MRTLQTKAIVYESLPRYLQTIQLPPTPVLAPATVATATATTTILTRRGSASNVQKTLLLILSAVLQL